MVADKGPTSVQGTEDSLSLQSDHQGMVLVLVESLKVEAKPGAPTSKETPYYRRQKRHTEEPWEKNAGDRRIKEEKLLENHQPPI